MQEGLLPRGVFRAVLVNKGGENSEREFTFDGNVRFSFPELEIDSGFFSIKSEWPVNKFICYDRSGNFISTVIVNSKSGNLSGLNLPQTVRTVALWAEDEDNFCSAVTNAVSVENQIISDDE